MLFIKFVEQQTHKFSCWQIKHNFYGYIVIYWTCMHMNIIFQFASTQFTASVNVPKSNLRIHTVTPVHLLNYKMYKGTRLKILFMYTLGFFQWKHILSAKIIFRQLYANDNLDLHFLQCIKTFYNVLCMIIYK